MSLTRVSIRPPSGCFAQLQRHRLASSPPSPILAIRWAVHDPSKGTLAVITARGHCLALVRFQSTTKRPGSRKQKDPDGEEPPPRQTLTRVLLRALWASFQSLGAPFRPGTIRKLYRQNPVELVLALGVLAAAAAFVGTAVWLYFNYFYSEQFTRFPEPVAAALRKALYYSNYNPDPKRALKFYREALDLCDQMKLDPFSDDVMGIKIQVAAWLEKIENYESAAKVLESLLADCKRWVDVMEKSVKDGTSAKLPAPTPQRLETSEPVPGEPANVPETLWGKRTRVLRKTAAISIKLAEIYSDEHVMKHDLARPHLIWAVETTLREFQRRTAEGVKDGEGEWLTSEELGGTLEALGHDYESKSQFHLALPLFFQALKLSSNQCHSAVLMNNIATCFAQHPILPAGESPADSMMEQSESQPSVLPAVRRAAYLAAARRWAANANQHASEPQGDRRTGECDQACAVSLCNLADIACLSGNPAEAREKFEEAIAVSKAIGFAPGIAQAEAGLQALSKQT